MDYAIDHCEPFDGEIINPWMKCEHIGRYLFAIDFFTKLKSKKILDVACAEGFGSYLLSKAGFNVYGADINEKYIERAKERCSGKFINLDFEKDIFPKEFRKADGGVCFETIEHLRNGQVLLNKLGECIKSGGYLILSFPNSKFEKVDENGINYDPFHLKIYRKEQMSRMIKKAGFEKIDEYGQSLCNFLYQAESNAVKENRLSNKQIDDLFNYDEKYLLSLAKLIGYPDKTHLNESYSYIWILQKSKD